MKHLIFRIWWIWVLVIGGASLFFLPVPSLFQLKEIVVLTPPARMSEIELARRTGVSQGENLLTLSLSQVRKNLLVLLWIEEVELAKAYPGRLIVSVKERETLALVKLDQLYLASQKGEIFKKLEKNDPKDLPVITGLSLTPPVKNQSVPLELVRLIQDFQSRERLQGVGLSEVHWDANKGVSLFTIRPVAKLYLGKKSWGERLDRFVQILPEIRKNSGKEAYSIDLTYEKRVFVKKTKVQT